MEDLQIDRDLADAELVRRFLNGDQSAFEPLYARHARNIVAVFRNCWGPIEPEDAAHEVWMRILNKLHQFDGKNFGAWSYRIARNYLIDQFKKRRLDTETPPEFVEWEDPFTIEDDLKLKAMWDCVEELRDTPQIQALVRVKLYGESAEQIAQEEDVARGTIDTRAHRGIKMLGDCAESKLS